MRASATFIATALALVSSSIASPTEQSLKKRGSLTPVTVNGNAFFAGSERFYIRGVDYQPGGASAPVDPLANEGTCTRDIKYFQQLGINTVRVYTVDNTANHDACMSALQNAGIYLALDVNNGLYSINRADPAPSYNAVYLKNVFATIDAFQKYDNTLLFFSGNEVINAPDNTNCAPYMKAVTRDMKAYIKARSYRSIPVGYSAADVVSNRYETAAYMNCGPDSVRSDFFAFNDYEWCDPSSFTQSGWQSTVNMFHNYSIPLFMSEFGCNKVTPRAFQEISALYNPEMTSVYSGGLVYEYSEEADNPNYGLVQITGNSAKPLQDFYNLQKQYKAYQPPSGDGGYQTGLPPLNCPAQSSTWEVTSDALPEFPSGAEQYMKNGAGRGFGLTGTGSQNAGPASASSALPSGASSTGGSSSSQGAAAGLRPAEFQFGGLACGLVVVISSLLGASLL